MATLQKGRAIYRVRQVQSPIHQEFRGLRIEVALPNMAGRKPFSDEVCPSFDKPYFVCRFGDYESWEYVNRKWPSIWRALSNMGFTSAEQYNPSEEEQQAAAQSDNPTTEHNK